MAEFITASLFASAAEGKKVKIRKETSLDELKQLFQQKFCIAPSKIYDEDGCEIDDDWSEFISPQTPLKFYAKPKCSTTQVNNNQANEGSNIATSSSSLNNNNQDDNMNKITTSYKDYRPELIELYPTNTGHRQLRMQLSSNFKHNSERATHENMYAIAFLGNTTAGKSFILRSLAGIENSDKKPDLMQFTDDLVSTSSGMNIYYSKSSQLEQGCIGWLDFEGESGSAPKGIREAFSEACKRYFNGISEQEIDILRRNAVTKFFPILAFLMSDVLIYVNTEEFVSSSYRDKVYGLAGQIADNIAEVERPILVLVHNKAGLEPTDIETSTNAFKRKHNQDGALNRFFQEIICVRLPNTDYSSRHVSGQELFSKQIRELQIRLLGLLEHRRKMRIESGATLISEQLWYSLLKVATENLDRGESIHISKILSKIIIPKDTIIGHITFFFHCVFPSGSPDHELYLRARSLAVIQLARLWAVHISKQTEPMRKALLDTSSEARRKLAEDVQQKVALLLQELARKEPCTAFYDGKGTTINRTKPVCGKGRGVHNKSHTTSEKVNWLTYWTETTGFWFWKKVHSKSAWVEYQYDQWDGEWQGGIPESIGSIATEVENRIIDIIAQKVDLYDSALYALAEKGLQDKIPFRFFNGHEACFICFRTATNNTAWDQPAPLTPEEPRLTICPTCDGQRKLRK